MAEQIIICIIAILVSFLVCIKEWKGSTDNQKLALSILLVISIGAAFLSCLFGILKDKKEQENVSLLKRIDELNQKQSDTLQLNLEKSLQIIELQQQSLDSASDVLRQQADLKAAYMTISSLQNEKLQEMIGGQTPPTINILAQTTADIMFNSETKRWDSPDFFVEIIFALSNESKYHLKSVIAKMHCDNYPNFRKVIPKSDKSVNFIIYDNNAGLSYEKDTNLSTLPAKKIKHAFTIRAPIGLDEYMFNLKVEWSNGYYYTLIFLRPSNLSHDHKKYLLNLSRIESYGADGKRQEIKHNFLSNNVLQ